MFCSHLQTIFTHFILLIISPPSYLPRVSKTKQTTIKPWAVVGQPLGVHTHASSQFLSWLHLHVQPSFFTSAAFVQALTASSLEHHPECLSLLPSTQHWMIRLTSSEPTSNPLLWRTEQLAAPPSLSILHLNFVAKMARPVRIQTQLSFPILIFPMQIHLKLEPEDWLFYVQCPSSACNVFPCIPPKKCFHSPD